MIEPEQTTAATVDTFRLPYRSTSALPSQPVEFMTAIARPCSSAVTPRLWPNSSRKLVKRTPKE